MKKTTQNLTIIFFITITSNYSNTNPGQWSKDFLDSMSVNFETSLGKEYEPDYKQLYEQKINKSKRYPQMMLDFKKLYEKNNLFVSWDKKQGVPKLRIPKKIHQIWLGSELPKEYKKWQQTWINMHPDWEYKLWTDKEVKNITLYNQELFDKAKSFGEKADILRGEILYREGGLYVDTDFECLKPFDILHYTYDFYTGMVALEAGAILANGIIGTAPGHPAMKYYIESLKARWLKWSDQNNKNNVLWRSGPYPFEEAVYRAMLENTTQMIALPPTYFFPIKHSIVLNTPWKLTQDYIASLIRPETFTIHYWEGSWAKAVAYANKKS